MRPMIVHFKFLCLKLFELFKAPDDFRKDKYSRRQF